MGVGESLVTMHGVIAEQPDGVELALRGSRHDRDERGVVDELREPIVVGPRESLDVIDVLREELGGATRLRPRGAWVALRVLLRAGGCLPQLRPALHREVEVPHS